ncbi:MAG: hypothetical protein C4530_15365 [Desulfobacteraceae bacterium]|nr:MAG: hypothetical protein C4530_15365 [Desulfobacteraceae bacterium]
MAGVTFLLEQHLKRPSFSRAFLRESVEAFEAVGPWLLTLLCLGIIGFTVKIMTGEMPVQFYLMVSYASALSLVTIAPIHTMMTRFMSDEIFRVNYQGIVECLITATICAVGVSFAVAGPIVFMFSGIELNQRLGFIGLTVLLSLFWCISAGLSALRKERLFLLLFSIGVFLLLIVFHAARPRQIITLLLLFSGCIAVPVSGGYAYIIKLYAQEPIRLNWGFLKRKQSLRNGFSVLFFYLGFWIDKLVFWYSDRSGVCFDRLFRYCPDYDFPFFAAATLMMFGSVLIHRGMKRKVGVAYRSFSFKLENNFSFREIALEKYRLVDGIGQVSMSVFLFYGGIAFFVLLLITLNIIALPWQNPFVFHYLLIGTVFYSLFCFYFLLLQYLDECRILFRVNLSFLLLNAAISWLSVQVGYQFYGIGFLAASAICAAVSFTIVNAKVGGLEYMIFMKAVKQSPGA